MTEPDYPFVVRRLGEEEGGGYPVEFPDLPGCMSDGETTEEAIAHGRVLLVRKERNYRRGSRR